MHSLPSSPLRLTRHVIAMSSSTPKPETRVPLTHRVPGLNPDQPASAAFTRYSTPQLSKRGDGVAIVWFRNDLRTLDNETLIKALVGSTAVLPIYCFDPRHFGVTHNFAFPKTGAMRAKFLLECVSDLKGNLMKRGLDLMVRNGKPEDVIPSIAEAFGAHTVFAQKETCSEELLVERQVRKGLQQVSLEKQKVRQPKLELVWGLTMYHIDDLPFRVEGIPDVYTQFRKAVEARCSVRGCYKLPVSLGPAPSGRVIEQVGGWGTVPSLEDLGIEEKKCERGMHFIGGESAALGRVYEYFWKKDLVRVYKETRNGMVGPDYSTKFSPWLASGSLSPRYIYEEVKRYEKERLANDSTYWVLFELLWRDYFRFIAIKYGNSIFHLGGPRKVVSNWSQDQALFESWRDGQTGYPLIDANMKELATTGFMSNRGRQIVCSFLVRDMGVDWRMGAEWFETCLLDYDPCSNYGNWTYGAGVGNDPREDRYFSIPKQARTYDPEGEYVCYWLPQLKSLPKERRNFPGSSYIKQVVPLKFGNTNQRPDYGRNARRGGRNVYPN